MDISTLEQNIKREKISIEKNQEFLETSKEAREKYAERQKGIFSALPANLKEAITYRKKLVNAGRGTFILAIIVLLITAVFYLVPNKDLDENIVMVGILSGAVITVVLLIIAMIRKVRAKRLASALSIGLKAYDEEHLSLQKEIDALFNKEKEIKNEISASKHRIKEEQSEINRLAKYANSIMVYFSGTGAKCEIYINGESKGELNGEKIYNLGAGTHKIMAEGTWTEDETQSFTTNTLQVTLNDTYACFIIVPPAIKQVDVIEYNKATNKTEV